MTQALPARLIIADPALASRFGHHFNYTRAVVMAAHRRGLRTLVLGHAAAEESVRAYFPAAPLFRAGTYPELPVDPAVPNAQLDPVLVAGHQLLQLNARFLDELRQIDGVLGPDDLLFFHTVMDHQLLAIAQWLACMPVERRPRTNILLRFWYQRPLAAPMLQLCAAVFGDPRLRVRLTTDTPALATLFGEMLHLPVECLPIPHAVEDRPPATPRRRFLPELPPGTLVVGYLGDCRANKGFILLREIVAAAAQAARPCHFLIQVSTVAIPPAIRAEIEALRAMPAVTLVEETLSTEEYQDALAACDVVLIAYYASHYRYGSSGILTEALAAGKVTVLPAGTSMAEEAQRWGSGHVRFDEFAAASVSAALHRVLAEHDRLAARARQAAPAVGRHHDADNLMRALLEEPPAD